MLWTYSSLDYLTEDPEEKNDKKLLFCCFYNFFIQCSIQFIFHTNVTNDMGNRYITQNNCLVSWVRSRGGLFAVFDPTLLLALPCNSLYRLVDSSKYVVDYFSNYFSNAFGVAMYGVPFVPFVPMFINNHATL